MRACSLWESCLPPSPPPGFQLACHPMLALPLEPARGAAFHRLFPQEVGELYVVSKFFVEEWRKFVR